MSWCGVQRQQPVRPTLDKRMPQSPRPSQQRGHRSAFTHLAGHRDNALLTSSLQFMDLRTRYTALVTLMTQYIKFAGDSLKRLEEEEVTVNMLHPCEWERGLSRNGNALRRKSKLPDEFTWLLANMRVIHWKLTLEKTKSLGHSFV